jgi:copper chaperone
MMETTFKVPDIVCGGCAAAIKKALDKIGGVSGVEVDIDAKTVAVSHNADVSREALSAALDRAGFPIAG